MTVYAASADRPLKRLRDITRWTALVRACPLHAHWLDGEPMTEVMPMGGVVDRYRRYTGTAGVVSLGDAWACTNPSLGRGISLGLVHAALLRAAVREHDDPARARRRLRRGDRARADAVVPRHGRLRPARLAEIDAIRGGAEPPAPPPEDVAGRVRAALPLAMTRDPEVFRAGLEIASCLALPQEVFARPGLAQRVLEAAGGEIATPARAGPRASA